ncbi:MAG TPA: DUF6600 domain-containing protein [Polyangiaceae bacterium]|nr:DUF6600 domain-containing protein [Polyangiaceae bacterium]
MSRRGFTLAAALGVLLGPAQALAQVAQGVGEAADGGWFDPPPGGEGVPDPYYPAPESEAAPAPTAEAQPEVADTDPTALTTFKPALDPYGRWVSDSTYGTVWVPNADAVGPDFAPYVSRGHWSLTADDDWIWVSDYPFGWAVFHYGRWVWISSHGWSWVPGRTYANAWVVWRVPSAGYAYMGWAPMPPNWVWVDGYAVTLWYSPPLPFVFCHSSYVFHRHVHHHIVHDRSHVHRIAAHTHVHPTPYHRPARPQQHAAASPGVRPSRSPPPSSGVPRGPRIAAARVPPSAIPAQRAAPPPNAQRLSGKRIAAPSNFTGQRISPDARSRSSAAERLPSEARRPVTSEVVRRSTPNSSPVPSVERGRSAPLRSAPSTSAPARSAPSTSAPVRSAPSRVSPSPSRVRVEPRNTAPVRVRPPSGGGGSRDFVPSPSRIRRLKHP